MTEKWRPVPGWERFYEVSDLGRVRSLPRLVGSRWAGYERPAGGILLTPKPNSNGYQQVPLSRNGRREMHLVHRLVLLAFVGPCPPGMEGCHGPNGKTDNTLGNLRWDTRIANIHDAITEGHNYNVNKTHCSQGHPLDYIAPDGKRGCTTCRNLRSAQFYQNTKTQQTQGVPTS